MTPEFYAIIASAIALAGLILNNQRATAQLRKDMNGLGEKLSREIAAVDEKLGREIAAVDEKLGRDIAAVGERVLSLGERVSRLEGYMEAIRDAFTGKAAS